MAQYVQITRETAGWVDVTVHNNGASDIAANLCVLAATVSGQERSVALPTNGGGSARFFGITTSVIPAGGYGTCCIHGPALVKVHEAVHTGDYVQVYDVTAHLGEVCDLTVGATNEAIPCVGFVMNAAGADGDLAQVFVTNTPATTAQ